MNNELLKACSLLKVENNNTFDDIKKNYKKMISMYHPDAYKGDKPEIALAMTQELNWAYDVLSKNWVEGEGFKNETVYRSSVYYEAKKTKHSTEYENKDAFQKRSVFHMGAGFYCWDPEDESFSSFARSIESSVRGMISHNIAKGWLEYKYWDVQTIELISGGFLSKLYYLLQQEYLRPLFCLCKLIYNNCDPKSTNTTKPEGLEKCTNYINCLTIPIQLSLPSVGKRTFNIEKMQVGDTVQLCCILDHPLYPNTIEVFNMKNESLGDLPPEYSVCISPLIQMGIISVSAKVNEIIPRSVRGPRARVAYIVIDLTINSEKSIENERPIDVNEQIKRIMDKHLDYVRHSKKVLNSYDRLFWEKKIQNEFQNNGKEEIFGDILFNMSGTFGQIKNDRFLGEGMISIDQLDSLDEGILNKLLNITHTLNNRKFICDLLDNKIGKLYYFEKDYKFSIRIKRVRKNNPPIEQVSLILSKDRLKIGMDKDDYFT